MLVAGNRVPLYGRCSLIREERRHDAEARGPRVHERWAHLRFSVIGQLLAAPPPKGELRAEIEALAARQWQHPTTGEPVRFGFSTIERWYYRALKERSDPVGVLRRKLRADAGQQPAMSDAVRQAVLAQYAAHKSWSVQLHHDNLVALAETQARAQARAVLRHAAPLHEGQRPRQAAARHAAPDRRRRARRGATARARGAQLRGRVRQRPVALGLPPRLPEGAHRARRVGRRRSCSACSTIARGSPVTCSGIWPRPPRSSPTACRRRSRSAACRAPALSDNGAAMTAAEITEGLTRLGILHQTTLPYSPYQNAKQEAFWGPVEGRLIAMLEHVPDLTLAFLNEATQAWVEHEYNRKVHSEIGEAPHHALPRRPEVTRPMPRQRRAAPRLHPHRSPHAAQERRHASSSTAAASRCPTATGISPASRSATPAGISASSTSSTSAPARCCARLYPQDKTRNASGLRRSLDPISPEPH